MPDVKKQIADHISGKNIIDWSCPERFEKFKKYWEGLGKPALEYRGSTEWYPAGTPSWENNLDYRIAGDRHWELRLAWVESDFTLPIEVRIGKDEWVLTHTPFTVQEATYRLAPTALEIPSADIEDWRKRHGTSEANQADELGVNHPMYPIFMDAIEQATGGKGQRHGGARTPFLEQPWHNIAKHTGFRGLVFQAVKKAQEACGKDDYEAFEREMLGSLVYSAMALIHARKHGYTKEVKVGEGG